MKRARIAAIDVGTTKVCTIMGTLDASSGLRILGVGTAPSQGMEKGLVADVAKAKESIRQSVKDAETMAGYKLESAYISVTGAHISSMNNRGTVAITRKDQLVRPGDPKRALAFALDIRPPADRNFLHVIPRVFTLDGREVQNPVGMYGYELNIEVHLITAAVASVQNLTRCVTDVGIDVDGLILGPLASAEAVLSEEEKRSGILIADIGGGTTGIAILKDGSIYHTSVLPVAGHQITSDIVTSLGLSFDLAEEMKKKYGNVMLPKETNDRDITVGENGHRVSHRDLCHIIRTRVEELIRLIMLEMPRAEYAKLIPSGMVITGGCANLPGIVELAQGIIRLPIRIGIPPTLSGVSTPVLSDPAYAASIGLLLWQMKNEGAQKWVIKPRGIRGYMSRISRIFR